MASFTGVLGTANGITANALNTMPLVVCGATYAPIYHITPFDGLTWTAKELKLLRAWHDLVLAAHLR